MKTFLKKINKDSKKIRTSTGFTIIETLVAIFILLITTTGPLAFAQSGLRASFLARDQVTAFHLAQEPVEIFKNLRDNNQVKRIQGEEEGWLADFGGCRPSAVGNTVSCNVEKFARYSITAPSCSMDGCPSLNYNSTNKRFVINGDPGLTSSKYTRTIYVTLINDNEIQVIVHVSWETQFLARKNIVIQENIYKKY